jgi:hypothetical protein
MVLAGAELHSGAIAHLREAKRLAERAKSRQAVGALQAARAELVDSP